MFQFQPIYSKLLNFPENHFIIIALCFRQTSAAVSDAHWLPLISEQCENQLAAS